MKVVTPQQMSDLESQAYRDGASESDFMEEAGSGIALLVHDLAEERSVDRQIILLCGKGNNAGDAYVAGVHLRHLDYEVTAYQLFSIDECSNLCKQNSFRFLTDGGQIKELPNLEAFTLPSSGIIIDGIFGTGFHGSVPESISEFIKKANESNLPIVAVDIPSGLNGETGVVESEAIVATLTGFLGLPKLGFFLRDGWNHVGKLIHVDYGLPQQYAEEVDSEISIFSTQVIDPLWPTMKRNRHKYQAGLVVGLAGSPNMAGAAMLSSIAALHGGAGIVRLLYPEAMRNDLVASPYEIIKIPYKPEQPTNVLELLQSANATFIGPGLGLSSEVRDLLRAVIPNLTVPSVIDADALTIIAEENVKLSEHLVLTPHLGEMKRLLHISDFVLDLDFLHTCKKFAEEKNVTLVLKGAPTFIFHPGETIFACPHGDPGMATAGSGDVLTGLIAALLAQGLTTHHAAILGVYLHALAGEYAAEDLSSYFITASDILDFLPDAFLSKQQDRLQ